MFRFQRKPDRKVKHLQKQVADLTAELEAQKRVLAIKDAELDSLAGVSARDRERVKAETATYARQRAESEGVK
jgi:hypothetical protein